MPPSSVITLAVDLTSLDANASVVSVVQTSQQTVGVAVLTGPAGKDGVNGLNGTDGTPGLGLPAGGFPGQILLKNSSINYDSDWANFPPALVNQTYVVDTQVQMLALGANVGDVAIRTDLNSNFILKLADASVLAHWQELLGGVGNVSSVNGYTGNVTLTKSDIGLGSVDNTTDTAKPVSTAQQAALDLKQPLDTDLTTIAGLTAVDDDLLQRKAGAWINRTPIQVKADLALSSSDVGLSNVPNIDATQRVNHSGTQLASTISDFDTQVRTSRLDQLAAPTALVGMNSQLLTDLADPVASQDAATKAYADAIASGLILKAPVRVASIANEVIATPNSAIDGVALTTGDRILLKDQTTASQNGIYVYNGASSALTRATDANTSAEVKPGLYMIVLEGATNADTAWALTTGGTITLGTTGLTFTLFSGRASVTWGAISGSLSAQTDLQTALAAKAALASPALTGTPTAPTAAADTNTTQLATTSFVEGEISRATLPNLYVAPHGYTGKANYICAGTTNNHVEINNAIIAANALPTGGNVILLPGTFTTSGSILRLPNVHIFGAGIGVTKVSQASGGNYNTFDMDKVTYDNTNPLINSWLYDLEIDNSASSPTSATKCINGGNYQRCKLFRIYAHDSTATGIGDDDFYGTTIDQVYVENCGYSNKKVITAAAWAANVFTFTTAAAHNYVAWVQATGTLTASGTISNNDTVTIAGVVYTFKTTLTGAAYEVLINGSAANALTNLKAAINLTGTIGTDYGTGTVKNPSVTPGTLTSTTLALTAANYGVSGNSLATTAVGANLAWGAATLTGGITGNTIVISGMIPVLYNGSFNVVSIVDANNFTVSGTNNVGTLNFGSDPGTPTTLGLSSDALIGHNGIGIASGSLTAEACIVTNSICIGNQNNNFLIEADNNFSAAEVSYIFSNCISINAGTTGFRNTGSLNAQFNGCFDYGSPTGAVAAAVASNRTITAAAWSGGVVTFTVSAAYLFVTGQKVQITGMLPTAYNGWYTVQSTPTSTTFTVNLTSDPGTALTMGSSSFEVHPVDGSSFNDLITTNNLNVGLSLPSDGVIASNPVIKNCYNYGAQISSASNCRIEEGRIYNNGRQGIQVIMGGGIYEPMDHTTITGHVYNNGQRYANCDGIDVDPSVTSAPIQNLTIDVHAYDNQDTKTQRYGVILRSGGTISNTIVKGNLAGNATAPILVQNTGDTIYVDGVIGVNPNGKAALGNVSGSTTFDVSLANFFTATLTGNITAVMPTPPMGGAKMTWVLVQDATGSRTLTLPANATAGTTLTLSTAANAVDIISWVYDAVASKWRLAAKNLASSTIGTLNNLVVTTPNANNTTGITVTQNDTTNNLDAVDIVNAGSGMGQRITQNGILAANKYGLFVDSSASVAQVNAPLARMRMQNASSSADTLQLDNAGTGFALTVNTGHMNMADGNNIKTGGTSGTKFGTGTTQKLAFYNSTPIVQPTGDIITALGNLGLVSGGTISEADVTNLTTDLAAKAPLASPTLTGTPAAPTAAPGTNTTQIATTAFVAAAAAAPTAVGLDTMLRSTPVMACDFMVATTGAAAAPFQILAVASGTANSASINSANHPGIVRARNSTTTNSGLLVSSNTVSITLAGGEKAVFIVHFPAFTSSTYYLGLHNSTTNTAPTQGCYISINSSGVATGQTVAGGSISSTGTTTTLSTATWYSFEIVMNSNATTATFTIYNDAGSVVWTDSLSTAIPTAATGVAIVGTSTAGAVADIYNLDYMSFLSTRALTRK